MHDSTFARTDSAITCTGQARVTPGMVFVYVLEYRVSTVSLLI